MRSADVRLPSISLTIDNTNFSAFPMIPSIRGIFSSHLEAVRDIGILISKLKT
jgi:hypothetical protein